MRDTLEIIYFISGAVVAIAACIGLYQLILTKRTAVMNAKRASFTLAAEQCNFYLNHVIPLQNAHDKAANAAGIESYGEATMKRVDGRLQISVHQPAEVTDKCMKVAEEFVAAMNAVEAFAAHFTNGVAADVPAFECVGKTYCSNMQDLLPQVAPLAGEGYYKNSMKLFAIWSARLEKQKLAREKILLERKSNELIDIEFKSLGT